MEKKGITREVYKHINVIFKPYEKKISKYGPDSLTEQDFAVITNIGLVDRYIKSLALKQIVLEVATKNYAKVAEKYSRVGSVHSLDISRLEKDVDRISARLVEAISKNVQDEINKCCMEYESAKSVLKARISYYEDYQFSQVKPEDFVKRVLGIGDPELLKESLKKIIFSDERIASAKTENGNLALYSISKEYGLEINEDLVQLALDYLNGNHENLENLYALRDLEHKLEYGEFTMLDATMQMNSLLEYRQLLDSCTKYAKIIKKIKFSRSLIFRGEFKGYRKCDIEAMLKREDSIVNMYKPKIESAYEEIKTILEQKGLSVPRLDEVLSSDNQVRDFINLVYAEYNKIKDQEEEETQKRITELSSLINPQYLELNPRDIERITLYGKDNIDTSQDVNTKSNLELLLIVARTKYGIVNPRDIIEPSVYYRFERYTIEELDKVLSEIRVHNLEIPRAGKSKTYTDEK